VALIVGTILMVINQGDVLLSGQLTALVAAKIVLTYTVPFLRLHLLRTRRQSFAEQLIQRTVDLVCWLTVERG
jgi:hypothetical protein